MGNKILLVLAAIILFLVYSSYSVECLEKYKYSVTDRYSGEKDYYEMEPEERDCTADEYCVFVQVHGAYREYEYGLADEYIEGTFHYCAKDYGVEEFCEVYLYEVGLRDFLISIHGQEWDLIEGDIEASCCTDDYCNDPDDYETDIETDAGNQKCAEGKMIKYYDENGETGKQYRDAIVQCTAQEYCMHIKANLQVADHYDHQGQAHAKVDFWTCVTAELEYFCKTHELNKFYHFDKFMHESLGPLKLQEETVQARCCNDYMCNKPKENPNLNSMGSQNHEINFAILAFVCLGFLYFYETVF